MKNLKGNRHCKANKKKGVRTPCQPRHNSRRGRTASRKNSYFSNLSGRRRDERPGVDIKVALSPGEKELQSSIRKNQKLSSSQKRLDVDREITWGDRRNLQTHTNDFPTDQKGHGKK